MRELLDNRAPVAAADGYYLVITNQSLTIRAVDLLRNDLDADGDTIRIVAVDGGANGVATFNAQGDIVYTAIGGFAGATTLTYTIGDGRPGFAQAEIDVRVRRSRPRSRTATSPSPRTGCSPSASSACSPTISTATG